MRARNGVSFESTLDNNDSEIYQMQTYIMNVGCFEFRLSGLIITLKYRLDQNTLLVCWYKHDNELDCVMS